MNEKIIVAFEKLELNKYNTVRRQDLYTYIYFSCLYQNVSKLFEYFYEFLNHFWFFSRLISLMKINFEL